MGHHCDCGSGDDDSGGDRGRGGIGIITDGVTCDNDDTE